MQISNRFVEHFVADTIVGGTARQVDNALYSFVSPTPTHAPKTLIYSKALARELELNEAFCDSEVFAKLLSGNAVSAEMKPYASRYGGHQFGNWAGQLGDGRAINLGELALSNGEYRALQLKGAGPTPYSRGADGRAVLRSSIREFLCSEAMHYLGVPTTRALSLVATGDEVMRDMFYDGRPALEPGAVVCRVAPSFTRFGHFELCAVKGELALLKRLLDYTIKADFPEYASLLDDDENSDEAVYISWFKRVCSLTAQMIVQWMRVGFVHGVMNTDNMSILGLTIDYGPYGWLDDFDPEWTPNTTDAQHKRYRFSNQPRIAQWNLFQLANALMPLINNAPALEQALADFADDYQAREKQMMAKKLGFYDESRVCGESLFTELEHVLTLHRIDMTLFYRLLANFDWQDSNSTLRECVENAIYEPESLSADVAEALEEWGQRYRAELQAAGVDDAQRVSCMNQHNPKYVLRNYLAQEAIDAAEAGDYTLLHTLHELLQRPYDEQVEFERFAAKRPQWADNRAGCSSLSCSS
ncbi:MAG: YdiU family protein [Pseudohongiellaceae bacterium]|nr:YdiU family protein [Pseudohongiellaceae bacterium]